MSSQSHHQKNSTRSGRPAATSARKSGTKATARNLVLPKGVNAARSGVCHPRCQKSAEPPATPYPVELPDPGASRGGSKPIARKTQAPEANASRSPCSLSFPWSFRRPRAGADTRLKPLTLHASSVLCGALWGEKERHGPLGDGRIVNRTVLELRQEHAQHLMEHDEIRRRPGARCGKTRLGRCAPEFPCDPPEPTIARAFKAISSGAEFLGWFTDEAATFFGGYSMSQDKLALTCGIISKLWDGRLFPNSGPRVDVR